MSDNVDPETRNDETPAPEAPVAVHYTPAPVGAAPAKAHPRAWVMVVAAVAAALLFMSIGAGLALGIARRAALAGLRRGVIMSAPGRMGGGYGRGGNRGGGRRYGSGLGNKSEEGTPSIDATQGSSY